MNRETRDERLRRLLREGDPTVDDPGLSRDEIREMRRTVLNAVSQSQRRWFLVPALTGVAMATLAAVLMVILWPTFQSPTAAPKRPDRVAAASRTVPSRPDMKVRTTDGVPSGTRRERVSSATAAGSPAASAPGVRTAGRVRKARATQPLRSASSSPSIPDEPAAAESETRQIQFSAPGGTRIIWVLTSDKASE